MRSAIFNAISLIVVDFALVPGITPCQSGHRAGVSLVPCVIRVVLVLTRRLSGCGVVNEGVSAAPNGRKVFRNRGRHPQDPGAGMADEPARHLKQSPAHRGDAMPLPAFAEGRVFEQDKEVVRNNAEPEEGGIGAFLATGLAACKASVPCQNRF